MAKPPNYAPVYCAMYPELAEVTRQHGYALAIHGTLGRDMDLICIPWVAAPSDPTNVLDAITSKFAVKLIGKASVKEHGREAYTVSIGWGECAIDLSFMPRLAKVTEAGLDAAFSRLIQCDDEGWDRSDLREALNLALSAAQAELAEARREIERLKDQLGDPEGTIAHANAITRMADAAQDEAAEMRAVVLEEAARLADDTIAECRRRLIDKEWAGTPFLESFAKKLRALAGAARQAESSPAGQEA